MQQDLAVAKSLGDTAGECRAHGNLGAAYFSQGSYKDALTAHRYQLVLAMKCKVSFSLQIHTDVVHNGVHLMSEKVNLNRNSFFISVSLSI